jgi:hypothetical protein
VKSSTEVSQSGNQQHVILKADPQFYKPINAVQTPEGGSTWIFIVAAIITMGWAMIKRRSGARSFSRG